jgi:broad specificity phosphatase PhoE
VHGHAQAQALAQRLKGAGLAGILSSDLPRALQTAQALADACGLPVHTTDLLHERNFGDLRGKPYDGLGFDPLTSADAPPGGESQAEFDARCIAAWGELRARQAVLRGPLAVVSHGLVLKRWLALGPLRLAAGMALPERLGNTSLTRTSAQAPHWVQLLNCTAHLQQGVGEDAQSLSGG